MNSSASNLGFILLLKRLWHHLKPRRRKQFFFLSILTFLSAFAEVVTLGAVIPFISVLTSPNLLLNNKIAATIASSLQVTHPNELFLPLTILFIITALIAGAIRLLLLWVSTRLAFASGSDLSIEVYRRSLYQPYCVHVGRNSSEVISGITTKVGGAVSALYYFITLFSSVILILAITITLVAIDPFVALISSIGFGSVYVVISKTFRRRLLQNSKRISYEQTQVVKALQEGLGGIRDVLLDGTQNIYCDVYQKADHPLRYGQGNNLFIAGAPKFIMESLGMLLIAVIAYLLTLKPGGAASALPTLGALALGAQRMLPALQQGYNAWASIVGNHASLADTVQLLDQPLSKEAEEEAPPALPFSHEIQFSNVRFRYNSLAPWVLNGINVSISKGMRVGFVGSTGSGKSTSLDLLMGLLEPTEGSILIDGEPLAGKRIRAWQKNIAHVPQSIYLADTSLAENIAFGVTKDQISMERVKKAAKQAHILDFIESRPEGFDTKVGERGIRLSGGQRQRIGIARALYKQANVLVFDEATSALDNATEQSVMEAIEGLNRELTIVMIAHRLTTVRHCDMIVELENGKIVATGTYDQLLLSSSSFRQMAQVAGRN